MSQKSQFLEKLYKMTNNDAHSNCIKWSDDVFWVSDIALFSRDVLPLYFSHNNYASFVRQLNMYGFHRKTDSKDKVVPGVGMIERFHHPFFQRGRKDLLVNIHRKTSVRSKKDKVKSEPGEESLEDIESQSDAGGTTGGGERMTSQAAMVQDGRISQLEQQVQYLHIQSQALAAQCARQQDLLSRISRMLAQCGIMDDSHLHEAQHWQGHGASGGAQPLHMPLHHSGAHHMYVTGHPNGVVHSDSEEPALQVIVEDDEMKHTMDMELDDILSSFPVDHRVNMGSVENAMVDAHLEQYS